MGEPPADPGPPIRPAATVVLLRDGTGGLETWLMRRVEQMTFAAGMSVFPGGRIDESDAATDVPCIGRDPVADAARFGCAVDDARAALVGAARETFEETGVLLTTPRLADDGGHVAHRRSIEARDSSFGELLREHGLSVDADLIRPWSRWLTPPNRTRRFDTFFYVALLPPGAVAQADSGEAVEAAWIRPQDALDEQARSLRPMLPPTVVHLRELAGFARAADVLAAAADRDLSVVTPRFEATADGGRIVLPDGSSFAARQPPDRARSS